MACLVWPVACFDAPETRSLYPSADFQLDLEYRVVDDTGAQVKRRASIDAKGLVIVREADTSLRSPDGALVLPVFQRLCVYRLHARSIRSLSQWLARENVKDLKSPLEPTPQVGKVEVVEFGLVYSKNKVQLTVRGQMFGQLRQVLRLTNSFLPEGAGFPNGDLAADRLETRVQDVPPLLNSKAEVLAYHRQRPSLGMSARRWQRWQGDTFALACASSAWDVARGVLAGMSDLTETTRDAYQKILADAKSAGEGH